MRSLAQFALVMLVPELALWPLGFAFTFGLFNIVITATMFPIAWYVLFTLPHELMDRHHESVVFAAKLYNSPHTTIEREAFSR